ncbi:MAG TPA: NAD-dependent protein deacylase [Acholeplasmatales bacterium]|nr:NAD-dependent protein deacylase [Acholeplasmatales bacterium]
MTENERFRDLLLKSRHLVFFGGAGVSVASDIPDFRGKTGLSQNLNGRSLEELLSATFLKTHPEEFFAFYKSKMIHLGAMPNATHLVLAELEKRGILKALITQNIDNLHQKAGSKTVLELHGSVYRNYCSQCHKKYTLEAVMAQTLVPKCDCGGIIRPDVVFYEEGLDQTVLDQAIRQIRHADVLIVGGTSLLVYPAAGLIQYFQGDHLIIINQQPTPYDAYADLLIRGDLEVVFEKLGKQLSEA